MSSRNTPAPLPGYEEFFAALKQRIRSAQVRAALSVNRELVLLYWSIGKDILERQDREGWGAKVIDRLARDLNRDFPDVTGFSARNLKYMRAFAETWPDKEFVQQVVAQLPWGHQLRILDMVKNGAEREWYVSQTIQNGWSRNVLVHQIESGLYQRQGCALTNFERTLPAPQSELAQQLLKDPYNFGFLSLGPEMLERDLERGLIEHLRDLILELGKGFAFVGSQYHLEVGGQDYYLDLLFYHLRLRCYVVIDLKIDDFKPEFAGKMNFYLSAVDDLLRHPDDGTSIGIILCKGRHKVIVEYALRDTSKPIGVAQYQLTQALPDQLKKELPTTEEFAKEFPLLSLIKLRIEIERKLFGLFREKRLDQGEQEEMRRNPRYLASVLHLHEHISADLLHKITVVSDILNRAVHGEQPSDEAATEALALGDQIIREIGSPRRE